MPGPLGRVAARVYGLAIDRRNRRYDAGRGVVEFDRPVLSVGNLSVGGTGKTPTVIGLVREALAQGGRPCIAMRGYASGKSGLSDEAELYRRGLPGVPVVAQPGRTDGLIQLFATPAGERVDLVVLDDGFQHRRIARQRDLVLIDATRSPFTDRLLPAGWLRERPESLRRAHSVLITHAEEAGAEEREALRAGCLRMNPALRIAFASHHWVCLKVVDAGAAAGGDERDEPVSWLRGKRLAVACAIGNPAAFLRGCEEASGLPLVAMRVLRDHDPFELSTVESLRELVRLASADALVVTEKDWVKLGRHARGGFDVPVIRPELEVRVEGDDRAGGWLAAEVACVRSVFGESEQSNPQVGGDGGGNGEVR